MQHNGGITQVNFNFLGRDRTYAFLNLLKTGQQWIRVDNTTPYDPTKHDANGYMHTVYGGGQYSAFYCPSQAERPGNYVVKWTGNGRIYTFGLTLLTGSKTAATGSGRFTCTITDPAAFNCSIGVDQVGTPGGADPSHYPHHIAFVHEDDEALLDASLVCEPSTLVKSRLSKMGVIRFLNRQLGNTSNIVNWADRTPLDHYSYAASTFPLAKYAGLTTNVGDDYTASLPGYVRADKSQLIVKFNASSSGTAPTIDDGFGAVPIKTEWGATLTNSRKPLVNIVGCLTYENRLGCYLKHGGDTGGGHIGILGGEPPESMIHLCRLVGADPSFVTPYLAADPLSDYMPSLAQLCKDTLNA